MQLKSIAYLTFSFFSYVFCPPPNAPTHPNTPPPQHPPDYEGPPRRYRKEFLREEQPSGWRETGEWQSCGHELALSRAGSGRLNHPPDCPHGGNIWSMEFTYTVTGTDGLHYGPITLDQRQGLGRRGPVKRRNPASCAAILKPGNPPRNPPRIGLDQPAPALAPTPISGAAAAAPITIGKTVAVPTDSWAPSTLPPFPIRRW